MKTIRFLIIISIGLIPLNIFGQDSDIVITKVGGIFSENIVAWDGGLLNLKLNILKDKSNKNSQKIKLKAQVTTDFGDPYMNFDIYIGSMDVENSKITIVDTLYSVDINEVEPITIFNKRRINQQLSGIFKINTKLNKNQSIFIHSIGCSMINISFSEFKDVSK